MINVKQRQQSEAFSLSRAQPCDRQTGGGAFDEFFPRSGNVMEKWDLYVVHRCRDLGSRLVWERGE